LRILFRKALARFSKLVALTFPIGLILITLFINFSLEAQKFQGNLYLAFSGASIITISLISAVIHLIVVRIDNLDSKIDILNKQYLINNAALCRLCVTYKK
jgi:hypothetical protein